MSPEREADLATLEAGELWCLWEAHPPRISNEERRLEGEALYAEWAGLRTRRRRAALLTPRFWSAPLVEVLLEKSAASLPREPRQALAFAEAAEALAGQLLRPDRNGAGVALYLGRAKYLTGIAWRRF